MSPSGRSEIPTDSPSSIQKPIAQLARAQHEREQDQRGEPGRDARAAAA